MNFIALRIAGIFALIAVLASPARADNAVGNAASSAHFHSRTVHRGDHYAVAVPYLTTHSMLSYQFAFDDSANYIVASQNQLDYNKLPGFSDCGSLDLARNGAMFGWRWNPATQRLQISAYANANGQKQYWDNNPASVTLVELEWADLLVFTPLNFEIDISGGAYLFHVWGTTSTGKVINASSHLQRGCSSHPNGIKLGGDLYFGGTATAPHDVTGWAKFE